MTKRLAILLLSLISSAFAAEPEPLFRKTVSEVRVTLIATDSTGRPVSNLSPADLQVLDNGLPVSNFQLRAASNLPLQLGIVIDVSESTRASWATTRDATSNFLRQLLQPSDQVFVMAFDGSLQSQVALTAGYQLDQALPAARRGGQTALYDALYAACRYQQRDDPQEPRRSALVLLSDGDDNLSRHDLRQAVDQALASGIAIYTISTHDPRLHPQGDAVLHSMAIATGGIDFVVNGNDGLGLALEIINRELRSPYLIYYHPPDPASQREFRQVTVLPALAGGPHLRFRQGYFTQP